VEIRWTKASEVGKINFSNISDEPENLKLYIEIVFIKKSKMQY
jgi:hypothetical protein